MTGEVRPVPGALRRGSEIRRVLKTASPVGGRRVTVYAVPNREGLRAAFVTSRSLGGAVRRNRSRRVLREAWRAVSPQTADGFDVVFVARPGIESERTAELIEEMRATLVAAGVIDG